MKMPKWLSSKIRRGRPEPGNHSRISAAGPSHKKDLRYYRPLYLAALRGNWEDACEFLSRDPDAVNAEITEAGETALHVVVGTGNANDFLTNLINSMTIDSLGLTNHNGETALSVAAIVGNLKAAELLVRRNRFLPYIWSKKGMSPLHRAALYGRKDMVSFLLDATQGNIGRSPYAGEYGILLLEVLTKSRLYDQALEVFQTNSMMKALRDYYKIHSPLAVLANQPSAFESSLNWLQRLVCNLIPLESYVLPRTKRMDEENQPVNNQGQHEPMSIRPERAGPFSWLRFVWRVPYTAFWRFTAKLLPCIKHIKETKMSSYQARQLFRCICKEVTLLDEKEVEALLKEPLLSAASLGIEEIALDILELYPSAIWYMENGSGLFQLAVLNRRGNIFHLIYQMSDYKELVTSYFDSDKNNILHLAGKLAPSHRLNLIPGVVFQMQYELKWFKQVEKLVKPSYKDMKNKNKQTPEMLFIEEHKGLLLEAKEWIKGTASSCMTAATLIATVVFAAAITVPGGNDQNTGFPMFSRAKAFSVFAIADAASLFSSVVSILMFLAILSSRYYHTDFLHTLPRRLIIGLFTLFLSISSLMVAFTVAIYLVIGRGKSSILITVGVFAGLSVLLFLTSQGALLWEVFWHTCRPVVSGSQRGNHNVY